jgi:hypothetical protein
MITVYEVSSPDLQATRLHLPNSTWGNTVRERLLHSGYKVQATDQEQHPDTRDAAELARRDAILDLVDPLERAL